LFLSTFYFLTNEDIFVRLNDQLLQQLS